LQNEARQYVNIGYMEQKRDIKDKEKKKGGEREKKMIFIN